MPGQLETISSVGKPVDCLGESVRESEKCEARYRVPFIKGPICTSDTLGAQASAQKKNIGKLTMWSLESRESPPARPLPPFLPA